MLNPYLCKKRQYCISHPKTQEPLQDFSLNFVNLIEIGEWSEWQPGRKISESVIEIRGKIKIAQSSENKNISSTLQN